jgi:tRNA modification GTPase
VLASRVRALEEPLRELHADLEGVLNFPDEAEGADAASGERVAALRAQAEALLAEAGRGRLVRRGARVALFGPVNAGKSTLFNRLVGEARALVDDEPGTTRDALEARVEWDGLGVTLFDTAGLREAPGRVEALGIARTRELLAGVDLAVLVLPPEATETEAEAWLRDAGATPVLAVDGKCDVAAGQEEAHGGGARTEPVPAASPGPGSTAASVFQVTAGAIPSARMGDSGLTAPDVTPTPRPRVSGLTGEGVESLRAAMLGQLWGGGTPSAVALVSERHADALRRAAEALARAGAASHASTLEVVSGEVGLALEALGEVSGTTVSEALLDAIFQRFCIGK